MPRSEETGQYLAILTPQQKSEIFHKYIDAVGTKHARSFNREQAELYGVSPSNIYAITHDEKRIKEWLARGNHAMDIAMGKLQRALIDAVNTQIDFINDESIPMPYQQLRQNAAKDIMDRMGLRRKDADENTFKIVFGGVEVPIGMPPTEGKQEV